MVLKGEEITCFYSKDYFDGGIEWNQDTRPRFTPLDTRLKFVESNFYPTAQVTDSEVVMLILEIFELVIQKRAPLCFLVGAGISNEVVHCPRDLEDDCWLLESLNQKDSYLKVLENWKDFLNFWENATPTTFQTCMILT